MLERTTILNGVRNGNKPKRILMKQHFRNDTNNLMRNYQYLLDQDFTGKTGLYHDKHQWYNKSKK